MKWTLYLNNFTTKSGFRLQFLMQSAFLMHHCSRGLMTSPIMEVRVKSVCSTSIYLKSLTGASGTPPRNPSTSMFGSGIMKGSDIPDTWLQGAGIKIRKKHEFFFLYN